MINKIACVVFLITISLSCFSQEKTNSLRNYYNEDFNPFAKKKWFTSLVLNFSSTKTTDQTILFQEIDNKDDSSFGFGVAGGYFIADKMAIGIRYNFLESKQDIDFGKDNEVENFKSASSSNTVTVFLKNYIPLSSNQRFNIFNETDMTFGHRSDLSRRTMSLDDITKLYKNNLIFKLGIKPGINFFVVKGFSFETSLDLIGLKIENTTTKRDNEPDGKSTNVKFDFDISLLTLNFSLAYYF